MLNFQRHREQAHILTWPHREYINNRVQSREQEGVGVERCCLSYKAEAEKPREEIQVAA